MLRGMLAATVVAFVVVIVAARAEASVGAGALVVSPGSGPLGEEFAPRAPSGAAVFVGYRAAA